jgi:hypothetical protein
MTNTELGTNLVPQYTNFNVKFSNITRDGSGFAFNTVGAWIFGMASGFTGGVPNVIKASTGVASGDFTIDSVGKNVTVAVRANELSHAKGTFYVALWADTSGNRITHNQKYINIFEQLRPSGV